MHLKRDFVTKNQKSARFSSNWVSQLLIIHLSKWFNLGFHLAILYWVPRMIAVWSIIIFAPFYLLERKLTKTCVFTTVKFHGIENVIIRLQFCPTITKFLLEISIVRNIFCWIWWLSTNEQLIENIPPWFLVRWIQLVQRKADMKFWNIQFCATLHRFNSWSWQTSPLLLIHCHICLQNLINQILSLTNLKISLKIIECKRNWWWK